MKLLLDQNLSPKLVESLNEIYPGSVHVKEIGLDRALDEDIWFSSICRLDKKRKLYNIRNKKYFSR